MFQLPNKEADLLGLCRLREQNLDCRQWYVTDDFLKACSTIESELPRAAYEGNSPPVKYATFIELVDPYLRAQTWRKFTAAHRHAVNVLIGHFKS